MILAGLSVLHIGSGIARVLLQKRAASVAAYNVLFLNVKNDSTTHALPLQVNVLHNQLRLHPTG